MNLKKEEKRPKELRDNKAIYTKQRPGERYVEVKKQLISQRSQRVLSR